MEHRDSLQPHAQQPERPSRQLALGMQRPPVPAELRLGVSTAAMLQHRQEAQQPHGPAPALPGGPYPAWQGAEGLLEMPLPCGSLRPPVDHPLTLPFQPVACRQADLWEAPLAALEAVRVAAPFAGRLVEARQRLRHLAGIQQVMRPPRVIRETARVEDGRGLDAGLEDELVLVAALRARDGGTAALEPVAQPGDDRREQITVPSARPQGVDQGLAGHRAASGDQAQAMFVQASDLTIARGDA